MNRKFTREETIAYIKRINKRIEKATNWTPPKFFYYQLGDRSGMIRADNRSEARSLIKAALKVDSTAGMILEVRDA